MDMNTTVTGRRADRATRSATISSSTLVTNTSELQQSSRTLGRPRLSLPGGSFGAHWWKVCWLYPGHPAAGATRQQQQRRFQSLPRARKTSSPAVTSSCDQKSLDYCSNEHAHDLRLPPNSCPSAWLDLVLAQPK